MKALNPLVANIHIFLLLYILFGVYESWEAHTQEMESLEAEIPGLQQQIATSEQKVKEITDFIKKADEYKVRVEEVAKTIEAVQRQLPSETNDSQIISFFQDEMKALNIKDPTIMPGGESSSTYYITRDYKIAATGTFLQFLIFFERVGNASRIYNLQNMKLTAVNEKKRGRFQVLRGEAQIQAYRYNPEFKVDRGFEKKVE